MNHYIGVKLVEADPSTIPDNIDPDQLQDGYKVTYRDGYESWCPRGEFERANIKLRQPDTIDDAAVKAFIKLVSISELDDKTLMVRATLANGFIITETSSCVSPEKFDHEIGERICMQKIKDKVWDYLGFLLACARNGVGGAE